MNTDNGKSVDAKTPQFLWIYRLIFCTSSSHFYACAKRWHSWCKVLPNYHRDIFTLYFHWYGKWLRVSKAKENVPFSREKEYLTEQKMKWICYPHCCLQITCMDMYRFLYRKLYLPLHLYLKFFVFTVVCNHQDLFRERQGGAWAPAAILCWNSLLHVSHLVGHAPCCAFLFLHYSLQLKSSWISDELHWAQGGIEHRVNKPCSDLHSLSWIPVINILTKKHSVG